MYEGPFLHIPSNRKLPPSLCLFLCFWPLYLLWQQGGLGCVWPWACLCLSQLQYPPTFPVATNLNTSPCPTSQEQVNWEWGSPDSKPASPLPNKEEANSQESPHTSILKRNWGTEKLSNCFKTHRSRHPSGKLDLFVCSSWLNTELRRLTPHMLNISWETGCWCK